jgi:PAS domain S-box-containing protein
MPTRRWGNFSQPKAWRDAAFYFNLMEKQMTASPTRTILIVDDSDADHGTYRRTFRDRKDYRLVSALSAEEGLDALAGATPDLILLDYNLPGMDGLLFMAKLGDTVIDPAPVVMLTGEGDESVAVEAMRSGAADYLVKHVDGRHLKLLPAVIEQTIRQHEALRQKSIAEKALLDRTLELHVKERELQQALALNQSILRTSVVGIGVYRRDGQCIMINPSYAELMGGTEQELLSENFHDSSSWSESGLRAWAEDVLRSGRHEEHEIHFTSRFGSRRWLHCRLSSFEIGEESNLLLMLQDIDERKRAEDELRVAAVAFETKDPTLITDADGNIIRANALFLEKLGYSLEEIVGKNPRIFKSDRHDRRYFERMWNQLLQTGSWCDEIRIKSKEGRVLHPFWLTITAVKNEQGETTHYIGIYQF